MTLRFRRRRRSLLQMRKSAPDRYRAIIGLASDNFCGETP